MDGGTLHSLRTVEEVFRDFKGRRAGIIKALTAGLFVFSEFTFFLFILFIACFLLTHSNLVFSFSVLFSVADVGEFFEQCDPG